jgi:hypothetical protein
MASTLSVTKKSRGRPRTGSTRVVVRFASDKLAAIDAWALAQPDLPARPEALRRLVALALGPPQNPTAPAPKAAGRTKAPTLT